MNIGISQIKKQAKQSLKGHWGSTVLLTFIISLLNVGLPIISVIMISGGFPNWVNRESLPIGTTLFQLSYLLS